MKVLSQEIDSDEARYRIQDGDRVRYITIPREPDPVFDEDTLCRPYLLTPKLPPFPDGGWTKMQLERDRDGTLKSTVSSGPLEGIEAWHDRNVEVTTLRRISSHKHRVNEVEFDGHHAIAKFAPFEWWNPMADRETLTYEIITKEHPADARPIAPTFLAQLTEQGRVIGFLLENIEGRSARSEDMAACEAVVKSLHALGIVHGDMNRHNFIVDEATGRARMIDFEHAAVLTAERAEEELKELQDMFSLDPYLGTATVMVDGIEQEAGPTPYRD